MGCVNNIVLLICCVQLKVDSCYIYFRKNDDVPINQKSPQVIYQIIMAYAKSYKSFWENMVLTY